MTTPISVIKKLTCLNQAEAFQFWCILSWRHMEIKSAIDVDSSDTLLKKIRDFDKFSIDKIAEVFTKNISYILEYFSLTRNGIQAPRISIKIPVGIGSNQGLIEIAKSVGVNSERIYKTSENTGFQTVAHTGKFYINNEIPRSAITGNYINPRLNHEVIASINVNNSDEWAKCWSDEGGGGASCYKSTLIVPMTLVNSKLIPEFRERFIPDQDDTRTIFGFLCFDHPTENYFNEADDVSIGYIAADWMSLYLMAFRNYTVNSKIYNKLTGQYK